MPRAPAGVGVLFGVALALAVTLTGPLLLFNPWFTSVLQSRHQVPAAFDTSQAEVDRVTGQLLADLYLQGDFRASFTPRESLLDERERSHMSDVSRLVRILAGITLVALILAVVTGAWLRNERERQGRIIVTAAAGVGTVAVVLAGIFAVAFEPAFLAFHAIFFPPGTYLFPEGSQLIVLFPEGFWFDAALVAGAAIVLTALVASAIGFARWRSGRDDAPSSLI